MLFIFSTPLLIRHLWQLKTVIFLYWCLISALPLVRMMQLGIIEISLNRLVNGATASLVVNVGSAGGCQKYRQSKQAHLMTLTCQPVPALFVPATSTHNLLKWIFCQLTCLEQSISVRYL
jgi:hypothetical protein